MAKKTLLKICALGSAVAFAAPSAMATSVEVAANHIQYQRAAITGLYHGFDWFSGKSARQTTRAVKVVYDTRNSDIIWGHGSWACSPAGFGQMSTLHRPLIPPDTTARRICGIWPSASATPRRGTDMLTIGTRPPPDGGRSSEPQKLQPRS